MSVHDISFKTARCLFKTAKGSVAARSHFELLIFSAHACIFRTISKQTYLLKNQRASQSKSIRFVEILAKFL